MCRLRRLRTGASSELFFLSSLRMFARAQPFWTNVSLPSGRTSVITAWRSTVRLEDFTHASTRPGPITTVSSVNGAVTYDAEPPSGLCGHSYAGDAVHRPFSPAPV